MTSMSGMVQKALCFLWLGAVGVVWGDAQRTPPKNYRQMVLQMVKGMDHAPITPAAIASVDPTLEHGAMTLDQLLAVVHRTHPEAVVSGTFYEWREASENRKTPGLHLGYDIAYSAGGVVPAAWPGQVVAVTPWSGAEFGVTIESNGYRTTYGHIEPTVVVGDSILAGQPVGRIVHDHVDVKMRNAKGDYVDYGAHRNLEGAVPVGLTPPLLASNGKEAAIVQVVLAQGSVYETEDALHHDRVLIQQLQDGQVRFSTSVTELRHRVGAMRALLDIGSASRFELAKAEQQLKIATDQLTQCGERLADAETHLVVDTEQSVSAQTRLDTATAVGQTQGVGRADVVGYVETYAAHHVTETAPAAPPAPAAPVVESPEAQRAKAYLKLMEDLLQKGAASRNEVEQARQRYQKLLGH